MAETEEQRKRSPYLTLCLLAGGFLVALWAGAICFVLSSRADALASARQVSDRVAVAVEEQVRRSFRLVEVLLASARVWIEQHPDADARSNAHFAAMMQEFRKGAGGSVDLRLVTADGELFEIRGEGTVPASTVADRDYFKAYRRASGEGLFFGAPEQNRLDRKWMLPVSIVLPDNRAGFAIAVAPVEVSAIEGLFEQGRLSKTTSVELVRRDGLLLARLPSDYARLGKPAAQGELLRDALARRPRDVLVSPSAAGDRLLAYSALPDYPLVVVVSVGIDELLAPWRRQASAILSAAAVISLLALAILGHQLKLVRGLESRRRELGRLALMDMMTGTLNHSAFMESFERDFARSKRYPQPLVVMMLDIDFFKRINDGYGHAVGDDALRAFAAVLKHGLRSVDSVGRLGSEEFAIVLPNTGDAAACVLAERLRERVTDIVLKTGHGEEVRFTTSIGLAEIQAADASAEQMLSRAEAALESAKAHGRNRVAVAGREPADA